MIYLLEEENKHILNSAGFTLSMFILVFFVPFAIANLVLYYKQDDYCNEEDKMGLDVADYLLGWAVALFTLFLGSLLLTVFGYMAIIPFVSIYYAYVIFVWIWLIIGGIIMFRSNIECIKEKSPMVTYALALWCLQIFVILMSIVVIIYQKMTYSPEIPKISLDTGSDPL